MNDIFNRINSVKTMPELDAIRPEVVQAMEEGGKDRFESVQTAFRKKKNKLQRIPLAERTW